MKKTYSWIGSKGNKFELEAEYSTRVENVVLDADGIKIETDEKKIVVDSHLRAKVDGKVIEACWNTAFWEVVDTKTPGIKRIWGINKIAFTEEIAEEIQAFLEEVMNSEKPEEVVEVEIAKESAEIEKEIVEAKRIVEKAENQQNIPTKEEKEIWIRNYNNINNEGYQGYVPEIIDEDQYNKAQKTLNQLRITVIYDKETGKYTYQTSDSDILEDEFDTREEAMEACKVLWSDEYWNRIDTKHGCIITRNC